MRVIVVVGALLATSTACSSASPPTRLTCQVSLGSQSARVVLDSSRTTPTALGLGRLTATVSRRSGLYWLSVHGPAAGDDFSAGTSGRGSTFTAHMPAGTLHATCRA
jgi:hypothetical protein